MKFLVVRASLIIVLIGFVMTLMSTAAFAKPGYLRDPDIHGDRIVFSTEGDLWTADTDGGNVRRITTFSGNENLAHFSPDGKWIAFSGSYDGNDDIFVISSDGGEPKRLTWHPAADRVVGWTPDGKKVIIRSYRHDPHFDAELFTVPATGGDVEKLPIGRAVFIDMDPESGLWAFHRTWGGGTWKRYRGGTAPEIWVGHPDRADYVEVTQFDGPDLYPMWHNGRIYFLTDQGGTGNIWSMKPDGSDRKQHTKHNKWDARVTSMGPDGRIIYMYAGGLHIFDPSTDRDHEVEIDLPSERILTRKRYSNPGSYVTDFTLSPDGDRVIVSARGEIFTIPAEDGVTLPITKGSGARDKFVEFHPKGERILYITDESGEQEIVTADSWGRGDVKKLKVAKDSNWIHQPIWSPDGKYIAYVDQAHNLYIIDVESNSRTKVDQCEESQIRSYEWSPDGRWIAYDKRNIIDNGSIFIYDTQEKEIHQVTSWMTDDYLPTWDPDGRYLYFASIRYVNPHIGSFDFETVALESNMLYMLLLRSDVENPLVDVNGIPPKDDDEDEDDEDKDDDDGDKDEDEDKDEDKDEEGEDGDSDDEDDEDKLEPVEIEFEGLAERVLELPISAGNYRGLGATSGKLFYFSFPTGGMNDEDHGPGPRGSIMTFDLEEKEADRFMGGVSGYSLRAGADKMAVMKKRGEIYVVGTGSPPGDDLSDNAISMDGVVIELHPREEWEQIFYEGWRNLRDHYWDESMCNLDWEAIRDQYATLLPLLGNRSDLRDLIAEMIGELSTGHTYIYGGDDAVRISRVSTGLLGAIMVREGEYFKVDRIYRGSDPDRVRSPLLEPGVDIKEGTYILAINQHPFLSDRPFEANFENFTGTPVMLTVNDKPEKEDARDVIVTPIGSDYDLRYSDWVRRNREYVAEKTGGKIGYIHIPDMGGRGLIEFDTWYYPQLDKEGMVVDTRWNGGGFVSQLIVSRFMRTIISWDRPRYGSPSIYPYRTLNGPFVVLTNESAGSDGDIFPAAIQLAGLAPIIGMRSWGGVVGINMSKPFVDNGLVTRPEFAWWDSEKGWGLEGHGVDPDIEVRNLPQELAKGVDSQLDRGIEEVLRLHKENPPLKPDFGPAPRRDRGAFRNE